MYTSHIDSSGPGEPPDVGGMSPGLKCRSLFPEGNHEIQALALWGWARYLSLAQAPRNTKLYKWAGKKHFVYLKPEYQSEDEHTSSNFTGSQREKLQSFFHAAVVYNIFFQWNSLSNKIHGSAIPPYSPTSSSATARSIL